MLLKSLTYTSRAQLCVSNVDVSNINLASRHLNVLDGITGILIFDGTTFLQIIEGVEEAIDSLCRRIRHDERNTDFLVRDERIIEARSFDEWSMSVIRVNSGFEGSWKTIVPELPESVTPEVRELLCRMTDQLAVESGLPELV